MAENLSLADQAVRTLAAVRAMDESMSLDRPERHSVRNMKRLAEAILTRAFSEANDLAYQSTDLTSLVDNVRHEEATRALEAARA